MSVGNEVDINELDVNENDKYAFSGSALLPKSGIFLLVGSNDEHDESESERGALSGCIRIVTGDEFFSDPQWSDNYIGQWRLRQLKTDRGASIDAESKAAQYGVESLILEQIIKLGGIGKKTIFALVCDMKRLDIADWGAVGGVGDQSYPSGLLPPKFMY